MAYLPSFLLSGKPGLVQPDKPWSARGAGRASRRDAGERDGGRRDRRPSGQPGAAACGPRRRGGEIGRGVSDIQLPCGGLWRCAAQGALCRRYRGSARAHRPRAWGGCQARLFRQSRQSDGIMGAGRGHCRGAARWRMACPCAGW